MPRIVAANGCNQMGSRGVILRDPGDASIRSVSCFRNIDLFDERFMPRQSACRRRCLRPRHPRACACIYQARAEARGSAEEAAAQTISTRLEGAYGRAAIFRWTQDGQVARPISSRSRQAQRGPRRRNIMRRRRPTQVWPFEAQDLVKARPNRRSGGADRPQSARRGTYCVRTRGLVAEARGDRAGGAPLHYLAVWQNLAHARPRCVQLTGAGCWP